MPAENVFVIDGFDLSADWLNAIPHKWLSVDLYTRIFGYYSTYVLAEDTINASFIWNYTLLQLLVTLMILIKYKSSAENTFSPYLYSSIRSYMYFCVFADSECVQMGKTQCVFVNIKNNSNDNDANSERNQRDH